MTILRKTPDTRLVILVVTGVVIVVKYLAHVMFCSKTAQNSALNLERNQRDKSLYTSRHALTLTRNSLRYM